MWLNEGYATFAESLCVDHIFPDFGIWTQFLNDSSIRAFNLDSLKHSHPIEVPIFHPDEIDEVFDDISYHKGAAIIRMLHNYIGDDVNRNIYCLTVTDLSLLLSGFSTRNATVFDST